MRVVLYAYALAYLVAPETFSSANVIDTIAALPESVKYAGKAILAAPFAFHSWNGIRHLSWDVGNCECVHFFHMLAIPAYRLRSDATFSRPLPAMPTPQSSPSRAYTRPATQSSALQPSPLLLFSSCEYRTSNDYLCGSQCVQWRPKCHSRFDTCLCLRSTAQPTSRSPTFSNVY